RSCSLKWPHRSQFANTCITIIMLMLMGAGVQISRYYEKNEESNLIRLLKEDPNLMRDLIENTSMKKDVKNSVIENASLEKIVKKSVNIPYEVLENKSNKY
ncbi:unnamed protein product, partial [Meganyctiphanes norvegica]